MTQRFYGELAPYWPLISPVDDYADEAAEFLRVLKEHASGARTLLELGSGGGHNGYYLKRAFELTLTDLSESMLALSRHLNPECEHLQGDMRRLDLARRFDVVFVHDAIGYMTTESELAAAIATAYRHLHPGGVALFVPDETRESFEPATDSGGSDGPNGEAVRYLEWTYDPDPHDDRVEVVYAFVIRAADGSLTSWHETHEYGVFSRATWLRLLAQRGFAAEALAERTSEPRPARTLFLARRPRRVVNATSAGPPARLCTCSCRR